MSLADAYDALTSKRSYKQALSHEKAIEMIHNGECGSYNPLLLRCLDDVSDTAKQGMKDAGQTVAPLRRVVEELYKGQDLAAARMTQQLEDAYAKQDFFTSLSDELWFDYTAQPPRRAAATSSRPLSWERRTASTAPSPPRWCGGASSTPSCSTPGGRR